MYWLYFMLSLNNSTLRSTQVSRELIFMQSNPTSLTHPGFSAATTSPTFSLELRGVGLSLRSSPQRLLAGRRRGKWGIFFLKKSVQIFNLSKIDLAQVGVTSLVEEGAFSAAFPLHDVSKSCHTGSLRTLYVCKTIYCNGIPVSIFLEIPLK